MTDLCFQIVDSLICHLKHDDSIWGIGASFGKRTLNQYRPLRVYTRKRRMKMDDTESTNQEAHAETVKGGSTSAGDSN